MKSGIICTSDEFSQHAEDIQSSSFVLTSNQEIKTNVTNFLQYMNDQGCKNVFTIRCKSNEQFTEEIISQIKEIELSKQVIEDLFTKNLLISSEIENHLSNIETVSIKLIYPSSSFDTIYSQLNNLKSKLVSRTKIIINILISGIRETDMKFSQDTNV